MPENDFVERLKVSVGKPVATAVVASDTAERRFISEALLAAAVIFLFKKYTDGFAEGLGVKELGKEHAQLTLQTLESIQRQVSQSIDALKAQVSACVRIIHGHKSNTTAQASAERAVFAELVHRGVPEFDAKRAAQDITRETLTE